LWVAATTPVAAARAGRYGANLLAASTDTAVFDGYRDALRAAGHDVAQRHVGGGFPILVTLDDPDEVYARNRAAYKYQGDFYREIRAELGDPELWADNDDADRPIIGNPDTLLATLENLVKTLGITDLTIAGLFAGLDPKDIAAHRKLFAESVLPVLKSW
jgi:alkanesulfonate monooxygenase SsuD/methylene tetrahydromethanopterin reductase-like flavin-dependent oxidoreductase (luciferase family)